MSIHFVPQWVKPIKPSGSSATTPSANEQSPTAMNSSQSHSKTTTTPSTNTPFPALSSSTNNSPIAFASAGGAPNPPPMSYSRATHTPASPGLPTDGSYFPTSDGMNGGAPNPHPFRYTREQILGLYDEEKVKNTPIEFVDLLDRGLAVVAPQANRPVGSRELSDAEKKILSSTVHPALPRRTAQTPNQPQSAGEPNVNGHQTRRSVANVTRDPTQPNGRGFGGFGRGEGGALAGPVGKPGVIGGGTVPPPGESKAPGVLGGGFGGVGKRIGRGRNESSDGPSGPSETGRPWRMNRATSGNFEGVLGFGGGPQTAHPTHAPPTDADDAVENPPVAPQTAPIIGGWRERLAAKQEAKRDTEPGEPGGNVAGSPWSGAQKHWRAPIGQGGPTLELDLPVSNAPTSMSVIASPAATPVPHRDAMIEPETPAPLPRDPGPEVSQESLDAVQWFYRDPQQQEHGPFIATQMQDWFSHSYFDDALPVRRASETSFYPLGELKVTTGNAVRPFVSAPRPPPPPPNIPLNHIPPPLEPFRDLAIGSPFNQDPRMHSTPQGPMQGFPPQPFRNESAFPSNQFPPQQGFPGQFQSPGFVNGPAQSWGNITPQQNLASRFNNAGPFGSPGMPSPIGAIPQPFPPQNAFSPSIGQQIARGPDFFSPSVGVGSIPASPWSSAPQPQQMQQLHQPAFPDQSQLQPSQQIPSTAWQQPSPMQPLSQPDLHDQQIEQPSYFPADAQSTLESAAQEEPEPIGEEQDQPQAFDEDPVPEGDVAEQQEHDEQVEEPEKPTTGPPPSAWAPVPTVSRKSSIATAEPQTPSSLPPAPASLPAKPTPARKASVAEAAPATPVVVPTPERSALPSKPAPWASVKDERDTKSPSGPSLREIQHAEAKVAESRKQALAEARANNAIPSPAPSTSDEMPTSMSWGLPSQGSKAPQVSTPSATASPSTPVWGSGESTAPKKTLKQIQEEEEKRRVKLAQAKAQAQGAASPASSGATAAKRGYADLAATSAPPPGAGWQTVGAGGKGAPGAATPTAAARMTSVAKPAVATPTKPPVSTPVARVVKPSVDDSTPSVDFIRWTKQSLNGLNVNIDEFIQMLLSFPVDPPTSERAGQLEIISDSVYASSSTLDGRRFAQEFFTRRKADAKRSSNPATNGTPAPVKATSLADVLKTQPKPQASDAGFKIVKAKGKKKN